MMDIRPELADTEEAGGMGERMARLGRLVTNLSSEIEKLVRPILSQAPLTSGAPGRQEYMRVQWGMRSALRVYFVFRIGLVNWAIPFNDRAGVLVTIHPG